MDIAQDMFAMFLQDAEQAFSGWNFSYIEDRMFISPFTWSYTTKILYHLRTVKSLLDMGTGGGEYLSSLQSLPQETYATEAYDKNYGIAQKRLEPLGVKVVFLQDKNKLPFEGEQFELVINRHEDFSVTEVYRVLKPGALFITQQVGENNNLELNRLLGAPEILDIDGWKFSEVLQEVIDAKFSILEHQECKPVTRIFDIGALIYYLKAVPWQIKDFSPAKYREQLFAIHQTISQHGYIDIESHRQLLIAQKEK